jgi:hypothetical protein
LTGISGGELVLLDAERPGAKRREACDLMKIEA